MNMGSVEEEVLSIGQRLEKLVEQGQAVNLFSYGSVSLISVILGVLPTAKL